MWLTVYLGFFLGLTALRSPQPWSWLSDTLHSEVVCGGGSLQMDLLVLDQGHLLVKDLTDNRAGLVYVVLVEYRNHYSHALTTVSPDPQP